MFTGLTARDVFGNDFDFSNAVEVSKFHGTKQWKHVFVQTKLLETKLTKDTKFLYCKTKIIILKNTMYKHYSF